MAESVRFWNSINAYIDATWANSPQKWICVLSIVERMRNHTRRSAVRQNAGRNASICTYTKMKCCASANCATTAEGIESMVVIVKLK